MRRMAFISRHNPTAAQIALAENAGWKIEWVGDADAFGDAAAIRRLVEGFEGVAAVHPLIALDAAVGGRVLGFWKNAKRLDGSFEPVEFRLWRLPSEAIQGMAIL